jgi:hypothetical protein
MIAIHSIGDFRSVTLSLHAIGNEMCSHHMKCATRNFLFVFIFPIACLPVSAAEDMDWHWIEVRPSATPNPVTWVVHQGIAKDVVIEGKKFDADLYDGDRNGFHRFHLEGTISDGKIVATMILLNSDAGKGRLRGDIRKLRSSGDSWGFDRIILHDSEDDASYIGIMRSVRVGSDRAK